MKLFAIVMLSVCLFQGTPANTKCGAPAVDKTNPAPTLGFENSGSSQQNAQDRAMDEIRRKLAEGSGVVCENCPNGKQCDRKVDESVGMLTEWDCQQNSTTGRWYCARAHSGKYTVKCVDC